MAETGLSVPEAATESVDEYQRGISDGFQGPRVSSDSLTGKSLRIYCFSCHRREPHYNAFKGKAFHYLLIGMTFGLIVLFGPYRCRCCGHRRLARYNFLNLRYHYHRRKYKGKSVAVSRVSSSLSSRSTYNTDQVSDTSNGTAQTAVDQIERTDSAEPGTRRGRRRKKRRLKSVPTVDSIGRKRREQRDLLPAEPLASGASDFTIDALMNSFETKESLKYKMKLARQAEHKKPFVAKKAKPRKKIKGKPKRRHAKKERLTGPTIYCFGCKQNNEHYHNLKGTAIYFFFFGISFGLISLLGPFRCSVCSRKRLFMLNLLHPKYYVRRIIERAGEGYN